MTESTTAPEREPRAEKVQLVDEIRTRLTAADAVFVTEYRGLTVGELAALRTQLRPVGTELKVYKNTMIRRAASAEGREALLEMLVGPTALALVGGDIAAAAKALVTTAKANPLFVVKGGILGQTPLSAADVTALATLPSREEMLARMAGALQAPMVKTAGLLQALPRNVAYGLSTLIDQQSAA